MTTGTAASKRSGCASGGAAPRSISSAPHCSSVIAFQPFLRAAACCRAWYPAPRSGASARPFPARNRRARAGALDHPHLGRDHAIVFVAEAPREGDKAAFLGVVFHQPAVKSAFIWLTFSIQRRRWFLITAAGAPIRLWAQRGPVRAGRSLTVITRCQGWRLAQSSTSRYKRPRRSPACRSRSPGLGPCASAL